MSADKFFKKIVEAPAEVLEKMVDGSASVAKGLVDRKPLKLTSEFWRTLGPGLTTGAADDDPSGIGTYSQAGAQFGPQFLWLAAYTFPLMSVVQEMCARIGLVTGRGLAANIKLVFPRWVLVFTTLLLFAANTFNIGADLGAMAAATQLLVPGASFHLLVVFFALLCMLLQIYAPYNYYATYLKWLTLVLLAYVFSAFSLSIDWAAAMHSALIPSFHITRDNILLLTAVLGTTISPYLFFWQTGQELEEEISKGKMRIADRRGATHQEIQRMRIDVWFGMFVSNLIMFFIILTCKAALFDHGITSIQTAAQAAEALRPFAGPYTSILFTLGIIGTGMLAVPVLAGSASYAIAETFGWKFGLYKKLKQAHAFYGTIIIAMVLGLAMNFTSIDPIRSLIYSALGNGIIVPIILALIVTISGSKKVMNHWANRPMTNVIGWTLVAIMSLTSILSIGALIV